MHRSHQIGPRVIECLTRIVTMVDGAVHSRQDVEERASACFLFEMV